MIATALPDGWYRLGSKLLKLFHERKTWGQARQFCHSIGGELASIDQENENSFIFHLLNQIKPISAGMLAWVYIQYNDTKQYLLIFSSTQFDSKSIHPLTP